MYYYRQQSPGQGQGQGFFFPGVPGFPSGSSNTNRRIERLERQVDRLERQVDRLNRRLDRIERRLGFSADNF